MSKTYTIRGLSGKSTNPEVLSELHSICSEFGWEYNGAASDRYSIEPGEFVYSDDAGPDGFEGLLNESKGSEYFCVTVSKSLSANTIRNITISVKNLDNNIRFSITYEDDVLRASSSEKYIFLNIAIGICLRIPLSRLYYSPAYEWVPSVTSQDGEAAELVVTDVSYIPLEYIDENNDFLRMLPGSMELIRVRGGYILLCCERLFCSDSDRRTAADSLNLDPV